MEFMSTDFGINEIVVNIFTIINKYGSLCSRMTILGDCDNLLIELGNDEIEEILRDFSNKNKLLIQTSYQPCDVLVLDDYIQEFDYIDSFTKHKPLEVFNDDIIKISISYNGNKNDRYNNESYQTLLYNIFHGKNSIKIKHSELIDTLYAIFDMLERLELPYDNDLILDLKVVSSSDRIQNYKNILTNKILNYNLNTSSNIDI